MFDYVHLPKSTGRHAAHYCQACVPLRAFVRENQEGFLSAAALLAGTNGTNLVQRVLDGLSDGSIWTRRLRADLDDLVDLLALENAHDDNRPEAAYFAALDPWDPIVEEVCLLTDGLRDAIADWEGLHGHLDIVAMSSRAAA